MKDFELIFPEIDYRFLIIYVRGTQGTPYLFGTDDQKLEVHVSDFFISKFPVTQVLWQHVMGINPSYIKEKNRPVEHVSYDDIVQQNGFLEVLNRNDAIRNQLLTHTEFRLPTETEWEYAARGGIHWRDNFTYSGSNNITEVAWQGDKNSGTETHPVGEKKPNQLGIHDMCGNVWEWCQDYYQPDVAMIPTDGTPCLVEGEDRLLRGGCHHNWPIHCTVSKRYAIASRFKDGCIGFRIAISAIVESFA